MIDVIVMSFSLNDVSRSRALARAVAARMERIDDVRLRFVDARKLPPVLCDGRDLEEYPSEYLELAAAIAASDAILCATPVYNYAPSGVGKNILDILVESFKHRAVAVVSAAGSLRSHLAPYQLLVQLMAESETFVFPNTVMVAGDETLADVADRAEAFSRGFVDFAGAVACWRERSASSEAAE